MRTVPAATPSTTATTATTGRGLPPEAWQAALAAAPALPEPPPAGTRVVVVAAHPDDETLGAAGLLLRLAVRGVGVHLVVATDGEAGYPGRSPAERSALGARRRGETRRALAAVGHPHVRPDHVGLPDGELAGHEDRLARELTDALAGAALCLLPWERDPHPDHRAAGRAGLRAAAALRERGHAIAVWRYPIWMRHATPPRDAPPDLHALRLLTEEVAAKRDAVACHASQVRSPYEDCGPVLPAHVLALFEDGVEPFLVAGPG